MNLKRCAVTCGFVVLLMAPAAALAIADAPASAAAARMALAQPGRISRVTIYDFTFVPSSARIAPGTTITWINKGEEMHTATTTQAPGSGFDSSVIEPIGGSYSKVLWEMGSYSYNCEIHPSMTGIIQVVSAPPMETPA